MKNLPTFNTFSRTRASTRLKRLICNKHIVESSQTSSKQRTCSNPTFLWPSTCRQFNNAPQPERFSRMNYSQCFNSSINPSNGQQSQPQQQFDAFQAPISSTQNSYECDFKLNQLMTPYPQFEQQPLPQLDRRVISEFADRLTSEQNNAAKDPFDTFNSLFEEFFRNRSYWRSYS